MNKMIKETKASVAILMALFSCAAVTPALAAAPAKPNIVFFLVDDFGKGALACMGSDLCETPNIDTLAKSGMSFTSGYSACTVCSPSRAAILTGRYPGRTHITDWIAGHDNKNAKLKIPDWQMYMDHKWQLLPETLKQSGYTTGFVGKWHLMPTKDPVAMKNHFPTDHGFDINIGGREWGQPKGPGKYFHPFDMPNVESKEGDYLPDRLTDYAVDFVQKNKGKPFFLYMSYYLVHAPLMAKPELVEKYQRKIKSGTYKQTNAVYAAMVESLDSSVGRVIRALKEQGLYENTIVVFTGDNGSDLRDYTGGLRDFKAYSHEGGVREPVLISWPGVIEAGSSSDVPMIGTDYYPTLLDLAGLPLQSEEHLDGVSLKPILLKQGKMPDRSLFWHYPHYHRTTPYGAIRKGKWKLIEFFEDGSLELFDLDNDIAETKNLASEHPEVARALLQELKSWRGSVNAQMPTPNPQWIEHSNKNSGMTIDKKNPNKSGKRGK